MKHVYIRTLHFCFGLLVRCFSSVSVLLPFTPFFCGLNCGFSVLIELRAVAGSSNGLIFEVETDGGRVYIVARLYNAGVVGPRVCDRYRYVCFLLR